MTNRTIGALVAAGMTTAITSTAIANDWTIRGILVTIAAATWIIFFILSATDQIATRIDKAATRFAADADDRHADGIVEGMRRANTTTAGLRGVN